MQKAFYNINEIAAMLGLTVASVHAHLSRKNFGAVPPPVHLGRRLAWPVEVTNAWIKQRTESAMNKLSSISFKARKAGRPTKAENRAKRRKMGLE